MRILSQGLPVAVGSITIVYDIYSLEMELVQILMNPEGASQYIREIAHHLETLLQFILSEEVSSS